MYAIFAQNLSKSFSVASPSTGSLAQRVKQYFFPRKQTVPAVSGIHLAIRKGERVAFIGPNGAGKSTTIKLLTGIIHPTEGTIEVLGKNPLKERRSLGHEISAVFGHTSKLWYHLRIEESFRLLAAIYDIPSKDFRKRLGSLLARFGIAPYLNKSVSQLSLGEKMRCEMVASLLHRPQILFLDEPTIGLDMIAKANIRELLCSLSEKEGTTLLLTSHDTDDIETVCQRVLILDEGKLVLDSTIDHLKQTYIKKKIIHLVSEKELPPFQQKGIQIVESLPFSLKLEIDLAHISLKQAVDLLMERFTIKDLTIENPSLESILKAIYAKQVLP